jgi:hypothetical protein
LIIWKVLISLTICWMNEDEGCNYFPVNSLHVKRYFKIIWERELRVALSHSRCWHKRHSLCQTG